MMNAWDMLSPEYHIIDSVDLVFIKSTEVWDFPKHCIC